jgi:uncharacterized protein YneF (UPF0154 family)
MKLVPILAVIGLLWCATGAMVLGVGVLVYPAAWAGIALGLFLLHKVVEKTSAQTPQATPSETRHTIPHDSRMMPS